MKQSTRNEIMSYVGNGHLQVMNAPYKIGYAFTLDENGDLWSGEYIAHGDIMDFDRFDGFVLDHGGGIHTLKEGQRFVCKRNCPKEKA